MSKALPAIRQLLANEQSYTKVKAMLQSGSKNLLYKDFDIVCVG
jgi:hypothetical protein